MHGNHYQSHTERSKKMEDRLKELKHELWSEAQDVLGDDYVDYYLAEECCDKAYRKAIDDMFAHIMNITEAMY